MRATSILFATAVSVFATSAANAVVITRNISFTASDFDRGIGANPTPPTAGQVALDFTLTFNNAADINASTSGLTVNAFNLPYTLKYAYLRINDSLTVGTTVSPGGCNTPANSFCVTIANISRTPQVISVLQGTANDTVWHADTIAPGAVPEPATWAMMIGGFGAIGGAMRYRRRNVSVSFA